MTFPYVYFWHHQGRQRQRCAVTARGKWNRIRVAFADGFPLITSGKVIMRAA